MKKNRWLILPMVILTICIIIMVIAMPQKKKLGREQDTEFATGSGIMLDGVSEIQLDSLYKLCKIWGYAKYRHPSVVDGSLNWDAQLFRGMKLVLPAQTEDEANEILYQWLDQFPFQEMPLGEIEDAWMELQETNGFQQLDSDWILDVSYLGEKLSGYLDRLSRVYIADRSVAYAAFDDKNPYVNLGQEKMLPFTAEDDGVKLLSLFRFWNVYEYYSPNIQITQMDWDTVLKEAIPRMLQASDYREYILAIAETTAKTGDAHIFLNESDNIIHTYYGTRNIPCRIQNIDGNIVVSSVPDQQGLQMGDIIVDIDGISIKERIETLSRYRVLPEPDKFITQLSSDLLKTDQELAEVTVIRDGMQQNIQVQTLERPYVFKNPYKNGLMEQDQIGYIDPSTLKKGEIETWMQTFADTKGMIVDLRYYPSVFLPYLLGEYLVPEPRQFAKLTFPNRAIPGSFYFSDEFITGAGSLARMGDTRQLPYYDGKIILLMDETSMSQSEFTVMALRQAPNAVVVGSPSIGADGNVVRLSLPGSLILHFTGLGVYTPEGEATQRVGLSPDIECRPTIEGLRDGRDELMEKAVSMIH